jgi:hypothetical protein
MSLSADAYPANPLANVGVGWLVIEGKKTGDKDCDAAKAELARRGLDREGKPLAPVPNGAVLTLVPVSKPEAAPTVEQVLTAPPVTIFPDRFAKSLTEVNPNLAELHESLLKTTAKTKQDLPLIKFATFGDKRTDKGNLRHDGNVLSISGIEVDYDGEKIQFNDAVTIVKQAKLQALLYTSPSHTNDKPRWRVLCPTSAELPPKQRQQLVARLNGLFNGALAPESFVLSQSYYFGAIAGDAAFQAVMLRGDFIDQRNDLDAAAIGKTRATAAPTVQGATAPAAVTNDQLATMLSGLVADDFEKGSVARELCYACHDATKGAGRAEWLAFCATYTKVRKQPDWPADTWDRAKDNREGGVTYRTLFKIMHDVGRDDLVPHTDPRPQVILEPFDLNGTIDKTEAALVKAGAPIYQRGEQIVHAFRQGKDDDPDDETIRVKRKAGALGIRAVSHTRLTQYLDKHVAFYGKDEEGKLKRKPSQVFGYLSKQIEARIDESTFRVLDGIIECPTIRPDGTLLTAQGYDPQTRLLLDSGDLIVPAIPEQPSQDDAINRMSLFTDLLGEFPFVPDDRTPIGTLGIQCASRSAAISAILTGLVRRSMDRAPVHGADANSVATGKSTLCDLIAIIATGRDAPKMTLATDEEESLKAWIATLLQGDPVVCVDNVERGAVVGGGVFAKVITETRLQGRILGVNANADLPTNVLILVNGNNLTFHADLASRAIKARMDCGFEGADKRTFKRDIVSYARQHRGELVAAGLTILRAYIVAGRPKPVGFEPSRFHQWDDLVRGAVIWCGEPDPRKTAADIDAVDPERSDLASLHDAFAQCFGEQQVTSKDIVDRLAKRDAPAMALEAALSRGDGQLSQRSITPALRSHIDTIVNGRRLRRTTDTSEVAHFRLEKLVAKKAQGELGV